LKSDDTNTNIEAININDNINQEIRKNVYLELEQNESQGKNLLNEKVLNEKLKVNQYLDLKDRFKKRELKRQKETQKQNLKKIKEQNAKNNKIQNKIETKPVSESTKITKENTEDSNEELQFEYENSPKKEIKQNNPSTKPLSFVELNIQKYNNYKPKPKQSKSKSKTKLKPSSKNTSNTDTEIETDDNSSSDYDEEESDELDEDLDELDEDLEEDLEELDESEMDESELSEDSQSISSSEASSSESEESECITDTESRMDTQVSDTSEIGNANDELHNPDVDLEDSTNLDDIQKVELYKKRYERVKSKAKELKDQSKKGNIKENKNISNKNKKQGVNKGIISKDKSKTTTNKKIKDVKIDSKVEVIEDDDSN